MKSGFFLKLGVAIVAGFGLLLAGYYAYEPIWFQYYKTQLMSDDKEVVRSAVKTVTAEGERAVPYLQKWLNSENERLEDGACDVLLNFQDESWKIKYNDLAEAYCRHMIFERKFEYKFDMATIPQIISFFHDANRVDIFFKDENKLFED